MFSSSQRAKENQRHADCSQEIKTVAIEPLWELTWQFGQPRENLSAHGGLGLASGNEHVHVTYGKPMAPVTDHWAGKGQTVSKTIHQMKSRRVKHVACLSAFCGLNSIPLVGAYTVNEQADDTLCDFMIEEQKSQM